MDKIRIITDSGSDIIDSKRDNVTVLPMSITFGDEVFYDGVTLSHSEFYMKLIESDELPKTSLIAPASFADAFEEAKNAGEKGNCHYYFSWAFRNIPERCACSRRLR